MKEYIHFAHGNGFPSSCYGQLLAPLRTLYNCCSIDRIGHNPQFPVNENWHYLVDELIDNVEKNCVNPVIALGHSLGGVLSLLAAMRQPNLFSAVIMIDAPLLNRFKSTMIRFAKMIGVIDRVTPAGRTRGRRQYWQTREKLWDYLKSKPLFATFTDACLQDYIDFGFIKNEHGYHLRFDRHVEYSIFRTVPHHLPGFERQLTVPALLIHGDHSDVVDRFDVRYMRRNYGVATLKMRGSHMLPMEHPQLLADEIIRQLRSLQDSGGWAPPVDHCH